MPLLMSPGGAAGYDAATTSLESALERRRPLSPKQARILTDRIVATPRDRWTRIAEGHARGAASALGYRTWVDYCEAEFGPERFRIPRRHRIQVLTELKDAGMSFEDVEVVVIPRPPGGERPSGGERPPAGERSPGAARPAPAEPGALSLPGEWVARTRPPRRPGGEGQADGQASGERADGRMQPIGDQLGFTPEEQELIGALIEVDDDEFRRVLTAARHRGDSSPDFIRDQCQVAVRSRDSLERTLDRALRSIERAQELVDRGGSASDHADAAALDLVKLVEDQAWDLIDTIDHLHMRLDNRRARADRKA